MNTCGDMITDTDACLRQWFKDITDDLLALPSPWHEVDSLFLNGTF